MAYFIKKYGILIGIVGVLLQFGCQPAPIPEISEAPQPQMEADSCSQAETLNKQLRYEESAQMFVKCAETEQAKASPQLAKIADAFRQAGDGYRLVNQYDNALSMYEQALALNRQENRQAESVDTLTGLGWVYNAWGDYDKAWVLFEEGLTLAREADYQPGLADSLDGMGEVYYRQSDYEQAAEVLQQAVQLNRQLQRPVGISKALQKRGWVSEAWGEYDQALAYYEEALQINRQVENSSGIAINFRDIGNVHELRGDYDKAIEYYEQALTINRQLGNQVEIAKNFNNLGNVYELRGKHAEAIAYYEKALTINRQVGRQSGISDNLTNIGNVYEVWGKYDQALEYYTQVLELDRQLGNQAYIAFDLNDIGELYAAWGKYDKALEYYEQALVINRQLDTKSQIAWNLDSIGKVYQAWDKYDQARTYYEQALEINQQLGEQSGIAGDFSNIGEVSQALGKYDQALAYYEQALAINRQLEKQSSIAGDLIDIGNVSQAWGKYEQALEYYNQALALARQMDEAPTIAEVLTNIGKTFKAQGAYADAIAHLTEAVEIKEELRNTATGDIRRDYLASQIDTYQALTSCYVLTGDFANTLRTIELTRAKLLVEQLAGAEVNEVEALSPEQIQQWLPDDTAVLIYADTLDDHLVQVLVTHDQITASEHSNTEIVQPIMNRYGDPIASLLGENGDTQDDFAKVIQFYRELLYQEWPINWPSHQLFMFLFDEWQTQLVDKTRLIIVPDGLLNFLPFETLMNAEGKHLIESYQITYAQSLGVLALLRQRDYHQIPRKPLLAFGGASYEEPEEPYEGIENEAQWKYVRSQVDEAIRRDSSLREIYTSALGLSWSNLPGALEEVHAIQQMVTKAEIETGEQVNEANIKAQSADGTLAQYKVLHFATHGMVELTLPELSALVLSQFPTARGEEDDYLRIGEVAELKLMADFVNLSACETGLGKVYGGQGVVGLTQSFLLAGANGLSVSLWSVLDESTAKFMTLLYQLVEEEGLSYADALTTVKRRFLAGEFGKDWRHPYYWSPFVYYGIDN